MALNGRAGRLSLLAALLGFVPHAGSLALAQSSDTNTLRAAIKVAPVIMAEPDVETLLAIQVGPEPAVPRQTFLRIRGMPLAAKLSEGHVVTPGIWAVPLTALPSLRLTAPLASSGRTEIHLSLVGVDGGVLAETKSSLVVAPAWLLGSSGTQQRAPAGSRDMAAQTAPSADTVPSPSQVELQRTVTAQALAPTPAPPPVPQPAARPEPPAVVASLPPTAPATTPVAPTAIPPAARVAPAVAPPAPSSPTAPAASPVPKAATMLTPADRERAEGMLQRGEVQMKQGNLPAARQFFRRAADIGLAAGALRMGATYDPMEMAGSGMVGVQPDLKEAAQWYERARELGAPEAVARLARIQNR